MSTNSDPDQDLILGLGIIRKGLIRRLGADGIVCDQDMAVIRAFDGTHQEMGRRLRIRKAFDSLMRNGLTRHTGDTAREAGLTVVITDRRVADVVPLGQDEDGPRAA